MINLALPWSDVRHYMSLLTEGRIKAVKAFKARVANAGFYMNLESALDCIKALETGAFTMSESDDDYHTRLVNVELSVKGVCRFPIACSWEQAKYYICLDRGTGYSRAASQAYEDVVATYMFALDMEDAEAVVSALAAGRFRLHWHGEAAFCEILNESPI